MNYQEKFVAIKAIDDRACLRMRKPGDWYVDTNLEIGGDGCLSGVLEKGFDPASAIEATWEKIVALPLDRFLVVDAMGPKRRHYRWNDFMWEQLPWEQPSTEGR